MVMHLYGRYSCLVTAICLLSYHIFLLINFILQQICHFFLLCRWLCACVEEIKYGQKCYWKWVDGFKVDIQFQLVRRIEQVDAVYLMLLHSSFPFKAMVAVWLCRWHYPSVGPSSAFLKTKISKLLSTIRWTVSKLSLCRHSGSPEDESSLVIPAFVFVF